MTVKPNGIKNKRNHLFLLLALGVIALASAYSVYYYFIGSRHISTDNAYVGAEIAQITSLTGGTIKTIHYNDTDTVKVDDILVVIDDADTKLALARAEAELAKANVELDRTKLDYERRKALSKSGSVSGEEVSNSENAYKAAQAVFNVAHVVKEQATLDLNRTVFRSPVEGVVAKRQVQLGQRVQQGTPLMFVVPMLALHVDANFKEVQLRKVKIGQQVELISDFYGNSVVYHGKISGIAGGTGSAFALIPAQNATGNWIKVVQRLPVRIQLDPEELKKHPLKVGLSMQADIDISDDKK